MIDMAQERQEIESLASWWESSPQKARDMERFFEVAIKHGGEQGLRLIEMIDEETFAVPAWQVELLQDLQVVYGNPDTSRHIVALILREVGVFPKSKPGPSGNC